MPSNPNMFPACPLWSDRSLSDVQESAQYLAGETLPLTLLNSLFAKTTLSASDTCVLINLTGYDGWLEVVAKKWESAGNPAMKMKTMTFSNNVRTAQFVEKKLALQLMQDTSWEIVVLLIVFQFYSL